MTATGDGPGGAPASLAERAGALPSLTGPSVFDAAAAVRDAVTVEIRGCRYPVSPVATGFLAVHVRAPADLAVAGRALALGRGVAVTAPSASSCPRRSCAATPACCAGACPPAGPRPPARCSG
jgi:hypothetical protein